jgi:hypothetical protein
MKTIKYVTIFLILFSFVNTVIFAQMDEDIDIKLNSFFRLDPIKGISGDEYEENSKFVQRFIYSPLVIPMEDPYLQDDYDISPELSMIENIIEYSYDGKNWEKYDIRGINNKNPNQANIGYRYFRATLRKGLKFYRIDEKEKKLVVLSLGQEDVVFSYRMLRITSDNKYLEYFNSNDINKKLEINTLLYTKIMAFNDVYCDNDDNEKRNICFEMRITYTPADFTKLLVYVPILSAETVGTKSMSTKGSQQYIMMHDRWNMKDLRSSGASQWEVYKFYDLYKDGGDKRLNELPTGYGQYLVKETKNQSGDEKYLYRAITLSRNPYWCDFAVEGPGGLYHANFRDSHWTNSFIVNISGKSIETTSTLINDLVTEESEPNEIIYNIPISLNTFLIGNNPIENIRDILDKREMQISHNLYALLFGPDPRYARQSRQSETPMPHNLRMFFTKMINRSSIENIIRFGTDDATIGQYIAYDTGLSLSDIKVRRLYYPFYFGGGYQGNKNMEDIDRRMLANDRLTLEYIDKIRDDSVSELRKYYQSLKDDVEKKNFIKRYILGEISSKVNRQYFEELRNEFNRIKNNMVLNSGSLEIEILYPPGDEICFQIAEYYRNVLQGFFNDVLDTEESCNIRLSPEVYKRDPLNDYKDSWKGKAIDNARANKYTFYIYGWPYRLDILNDLSNQFTDRITMDTIRGDYIRLINQNSNVEYSIFELAQRFEISRNTNVMNTLPIPLISIQNYSLFRKENTFITQERLKYSQFMMFPYYWRLKIVR